MGFQATRAGLYTSAPSCSSNAQADRGLSRADLARDLDESLAFLDPENDVVQRLAMLVTEVQETRVWRNIER